MCFSEKSMIPFYMSLDVELLNFESPYNWRVTLESYVFLWTYILGLST